MLPKERISCEHQEVKEAESSRRPLQIIGTVGARLLLNKAYEGRDKKACALSYEQGLERGSEEVREMVLLEEGPRRKKKSLKMNHGKVINKGRTVRVGVRTSSF